MNKVLQSHSMQLPLGGRSIEVAMHTLPGASQTILLLHEALGSVSYWKDFPQKLAVAAEANVLLYSRPGHGNSEGPVEVRGKDHYHRQVEVVIPALLRHFSVDCPILYGHSEGAAIAILYAATSKQLEALILESPYLEPGEQSNAFMKKMVAEYPGSKLQQRLVHYQQEPDAVFYSWAHWASTQPEDISIIRNLLPQIACPVLVLQGADDTFGVTKHLQVLRAALPNLQHETFANTGHLPHREQTEPLLDRVSRFLTEMQLASPLR